jgi:cytochrome c oxidase subunit 4
VKDPAGMEESGKHVVAPRTFILAWVCLLCLTGLTIKVAHMELGPWTMAVNITISSIKASLVLWFFMHLKYERRLVKLLLFVPIITVSIIIVLTFSDVWFRPGSGQ